MEKVTKSYVEKSYRGLLFSEGSIKEVDERNPMKVENDGSIQGFRFFDIDYILDDGKTYASEKTNYSGWIYFGKRYSLDDIKSIYGCDSNHDILIHNMEWNNINYVCHTQAGSFLQLEEEDMTFEEYIEKNSKENEPINPALLLNKKK